MTFKIELIDSHGNARLSGTLHKSWRVPPGFTSLGTTSYAQSLRMRVRAYVSDDVRPGHVPSASWHTWKSELRWNG